MAPLQKGVFFYICKFLSGVGFMFHSIGLCTSFYACIIFFYYYISPVVYFDIWCFLTSVVFLLFAVFFFNF